MQRLTGLFGLLVLLGLAYVFSTNRKAVKFRTVVWGVGLQILLAVAILSGGTASFVAMFVLAFLIVLYMSEEDLRLAYTPDVVYLIFSLAAAGSADLRGFILDGGRPVEVGVTIVDAPEQAS